MATETAGPAGVSAAAAEQGGEDDDDDDGWLFAAACSDGIGGSPDAIGRYAAIIKDTDAHVYRRGMAVLAMGKALGRELGKLSGNSASVQKFRKVGFTEDMQIMASTTTDHDRPRRRRSSSKNA